MKNRVKANNQSFDPAIKFRDPKLGRLLLKQITERASRLADKRGRKVLLMEVCGTHTVAISRTGLRSLLDDHIDLRSGPGCPVCVTHHRDIDSMIAFSRIPEVTVATFGDMIRVPGSATSLERERANGAKVEVFYSPADAVEAAARNPQEQYVFLGVGFETTAPMVALAIQEAARRNQKNFSVFPVHKKVEPILRALLDDPELAVDGFVLPGHVSAILGRRAYDFIAEEYGIPSAIAGFEPVDILASVLAILDMMEAGKPAAINSYSRVVREEGNSIAQKTLADTYMDVDALWRGFGVVHQSGMAIRPELADWDASVRFAPEIPEANVPKGCRCGDLLKGKINPKDCGLFAKVCHPTSPAGPCMVSFEGACSTYYQYHREEGKD